MAKTAFEGGNCKLDQAVCSHVSISASENKAEFDPLFLFIYLRFSIYPVKSAKILNSYMIRY